MSAGDGTYGKTCPQHNHIVFLVHGQVLVPAPARLLLLLHHSSRCRCRRTEPKMAAISRLPIPPPRQRVPLPLRALPRPTEITFFPPLIFWKGFRRLRPSTSTAPGTTTIFTSPEKYGAGRGGAGPLQVLRLQRIHAREPRAPRPVPPSALPSRSLGRNCKALWYVFAAASISLGELPPPELLPRPGEIQASTLTR